MPKLIACLGYSLNKDDSVPPILKNRLSDSLKICTENPDSTLLLMGGSYYRDKKNRAISQAFAMKMFLETNFGKQLEHTKIKIEENTTSTIEQLCYLRNIFDLKETEFNYSDLVIVASKFFMDRVKLYAEYIFNTTENIIFIESDVPIDILGQFEATEDKKLIEAQDWLKEYEKGDYWGILARQKAFQSEVKKGEINHAVS